MRVSNPESEQVLGLLKELSVLKELDKQFEVGPKTDTELQAYRLRQLRQKDIGEEIKAIAEGKDNSDVRSQSPTQGQAADR